MDDRLFVILFFPSFFISFGVFFAGIAALWRTAITDRELKQKTR